MNIDNNLASSLINSKRCFQVISMFRVLFMALFFMFTVTGCSSSDDPAPVVVDTGGGASGDGSGGSGGDSSGGGSGGDSSGGDSGGDSTGGDSGGDSSGGDSGGDSSGDGSGGDSSGGDSGDGSDATGETTQIVASLGLIDGADVSITAPDGTVIPNATGTLDATGLISITHDGSYDGPVIVTVTGNDSAMYFDESAGAMLPMGADITIRAFAPMLQAQIGVTILTELAAQVAEELGSTITAADITSINNSIRDTFAPDLSDLLVAPALVSEANFTAQSLTNDDAGIYAATLAALANLASGETTPALSILEDLVADMADGDIDGIGADGTLSGLAYDPAAFASAFSSAVQTAVATLGDSALIEAANAITLSLESNVLQVVVDAGVSLPGTVTVLIDANDIDTGDSGADITGNYDLTITGTISTFGVATGFEATIQNIVAPSPSDTGAVQSVITETLAGVSGITNLEVTIVNNTAERITFDVKFSATQSGVSVEMELRYDYLPSGSSAGGSDSGSDSGSGDSGSGSSGGDVGSGDSGSDSSGGDSSSGDSSSDGPTDVASLGKVCFFGGEPTAIDIPASISGEYNLSYFESQAGAPYTANQQVNFAINVDGENKLRINNEVVLSLPVRCGTNENEAIWKDSDNNLIYSLSSLTSGFNEINVNSAEDGRFLGQFSL